MIVAGMNILKMIIMFLNIYFLKSDQQSDKNNINTLFLYKSIDFDLKTYFSKGKKCIQKKL